MIFSHRRFVCQHGIRDIIDLIPAQSSKDEAMLTPATTAIRKNIEA